MMKFFEVLMKRVEAESFDESQVATGTYADGMFPLTCEEALETRMNRLRLSYRQDLTAALRLNDKPPVFG